MTTNFNSVVEDILGNLVEESDIGPTIQDLFQSLQPDEIHSVIEKLKHKISLKNQSLRLLLSNNHQHLFACTDLVDQLNTFSSSAKQNHQRLENLIRSISEAPHPNTVESGNFSSLKTEQINMEIDEQVLEEYFDLIVDQNQIPKVQNLPLLLAKEHFRMKKYGYQSLQDEAEENSTLSIISTEILKKNCHYLLSDQENVDFSFFGILLNNIKSLDQILEIIASLNVEGFEITDEKIDGLQQELKRQKDHGRSGRAILLKFFFEQITQIYLADQSGAYLVNFALLVHSVVKYQDNKLDTEQISELYSTNLKSNFNDEGEINDSRGLEGIRTIVFQQAFNLQQEAGELPAVYHGF